MSNLSVNTITDASGGSTASINGLTPQASNMQPFNRIINGAMTIDQRNAGASVTLTGGNTYPIDRFPSTYNGSGTITAQRSTTAPVGFVNSIVYTVTTGSSPASGVVGRFLQIIEGLNTADLGWGTANAQPVTLSFWVRSSVTGTFGGSAQAGSSSGVYVFQYTINSANTWEYKTITIAGATVGTFYTDNNAGVMISWDLGTGSNFEATPNAWSTAINKWRASGNVQLSATTGATFYITGVQLEAGSTASSFAHENYSDTLQKCQRYYQKSYNQDTVPGTSLLIGNAMLIDAAWGYSASTTIGNWNGNLPIAMRANPTLTIYDLLGNSSKFSTQSADGTPTNNQGANYARASENQLMLQKFAQACSGIIFNYTLSAEL
jgi:hypothetical protein